MGSLLPLDRFRRGFCDRCGEWLSQQSGGLDHGDLLIVRHDLLFASASETSESSLEEAASVSPPFLGQRIRSGRSCPECREPLFGYPRWQAERDGGWEEFDVRCRCGASTFSLSADAKGK